LVRTRGDTFPVTKKGEGETNTKQFEELQKLIIARHAQEIGFKEASKSSCAYYTTVYY